MAWGQRFAGWLGGMGVALLTAAGVTLASPASAQTTRSAAYQSAADAIVRNDYAAMEQIAKAACDGGDKDSCDLLLSFYTGGLFYDNRLPRGGTAFNPKPPKAVTFLQTLCDRQDFRQCNELAYNLARGWGRDVPKDPARALALYEKACQGGYRVSCDRGSSHAHRMANYAPGNARAIALSERGCDLGAADQCRDLAFALVKGTPTPANLTAAAGAHRKACDGRTLYSCFDLGQAYEAGRGVAKDSALAIAAYQKGCVSNNSDGRESCNRLGQMHLDGLGVTKNPVRAYELFASACLAGLKLGCHNQANLQMTGVGTARNPAEAEKLYAGACQGEGRLPESCLSLGRIYLSGAGGRVDVNRAAYALLQLEDMKATAEMVRESRALLVPHWQSLCNINSGVVCQGLAARYAGGYQSLAKDPVSATTLYQMACKAGAGPSCSMAGAALFNGTGLPKNLTESAHFYEMGCKAADLNSCYRAAVAYLQGSGVIKNKAMATKWIGEAERLNKSAEQAPQIKAVRDAIDAM